ncbi:MAG: tetratricopeptide repeat protein [Gemmataceae bacterium]
MHPFRTAVAGLVLAVAAAIGVAYFSYSRELDRAQSEADKGHNAAARRHLARCRSLWFPTRDMLLLDSRVARRSGDWEEAAAVLDAYSHRFGDDDRLAAERLMLIATQGDIEFAAPRLIAIIEEGRPEVRPAREALIIGLLFRFRWLEAERNIDAWLAVAPDDPTAVFLRGKFQEQRQQTLAAAASYEKVLELDPEHDEARLRLTTLLLQQRRPSELLVHLEYLRPRFPDLPEVHLQWVKALALNGRNREAAAALDECLQRFPNHPQALAERGAVAIQAGDDRTAEEFLARATKLAPGDYTARSQYAVVLARNGKEAEAARERESLRQLEADQERISELIAGPLQTRPKDPSVPHEIAVIALRSGQSSEAIRWLTASLSVDPTHGPSHQLLANYHQASGNPALAAKHRAMAKQYFKKP